MPARYTAGMTRIASLFVLFALAGCGNKGPLVMADPARDGAATPATATEPATTEPATTQPPEKEPATTPVSAPSTSGTPAR